MDRLITKFIMVTLIFGFKLKAQTSASGEKIFKYNCSNCHSPEIKTIGPALKEVINQADFKWFMFYTIDAQNLIVKGDKRAIKLKKEYNIEHPKFYDLKKAEIREIYEYVKTYK